MNKVILSILMLSSAVLLLSCQSYKQAEIEPVSPVVITLEKPVSAMCKDPRSQICTREYRPVCATRDTGVRCVTTPCPSTETVTKANVCTACADEKVVSYVMGACK